MNRKNSTRKALLLSCLSLLLCMSMLVGTTFAWFTDSVSTTNNIITAGNLDVNLYWSTNGADWTAVNANTNIFKTETLWEPGHTEVVYLKVVNEGTLALKYDLVVNVASELAGTNVAGEAFKLSDYILYNVTEGITTYANSAAARGNETGDKLNVAYGTSSQLLNQGQSATLTMVVFMPTTVGNEANYLKDTAAPVINLGVSLFATQQVKEQDSYGPNYDADANPISVSTAAELQAALDAATGETDIVLSADITGNVTATQKPNVQINIDGNGKLFNGILTVNGKSARYTTAALTIKNVNFVGMTSEGSNDAYIKLGGTDAMRYTHGVTVKDCTFSGTGMVAVKSYTGGDWNLTIDGCTVNTGMHSLVQVTNVEQGLKIVNCVVNSKNGANLNSTPALEMSGCTFNVQGYAVRVGVAGAATAEQKVFNINNCVLTSACAESDDAVIVFRGNATNAKMDLTGSTMTGTRQIMGNTDATVIVK